MNACRKKEIAYKQDIVREIHRQLWAIGGIKVFSWGATSFKSFSSENSPFLQFKVRGHHFNGHVRIQYNWNDTYKIIFGYFGRQYTDMFKEIKSVDQVYFDQMVDIIDDFVEYVPVYGSK